MRILLIQAAGRRLRDAVRAGRPLRYYAPTTLLVLEALVPPELDADVRLVDQGVEPVPEVLGADLVGISAITSAAPEAYRLADRARARGATVLLGGHHASACPEEALRHADAVVVGYAEEAWPRLLRDHARGRLARRYEGGLGRREFDLPRLRREHLDGKPYFVKATTEATRGCPHRCGFCAVHRFTDGACAHRPVASVLEEVGRMGRRAIFFDPSLFEFAGYARELMEGLAPLGIHWYAAATVRLRQDEALIRQAARCGCRGLFLGFESVEQGSVDETQKPFNRIDEYETLVRMLHDHGIGVLGSFALGFDHDDPSVFDRTIEFVIRSKIDLVKLGILTPLPGTALHAQLKREGRLLTEDWERYDTRHCVFEPARMTKDELEEGFARTHREIYRMGSIVRRLWRRGAPHALLLAANLAVRRMA